jgi:hypothetical protein
MNKAAEAYGGPYKWNTIIRSLLCATFYNV